MGILGKIASAFKWVVSTPFIVLDNILNSIADAGGRLRAGTLKVLGFKKRRIPREKIRAELRKQWLDLAPGEKEIAGVEWEGEIYYETPK